MRVSVRLRDRLPAFLRGERGTILPFALITLVLLTMMGALAVNTVRFESKRSSMQATLDICVLSSAALRQTLDERTVFNDCLAKNNTQADATTFSIREGTTSKSVSATATDSFNPFFRHRTQPQQQPWQARAASSAEERVGNVEVSLVLDVSTSMQDNGRIGAMRTAAQEFVTTLLREDVENRVSITLVPYAGQVHLGQDLITKFNVTNIPWNANNVPDVRQLRCVDLPPSLFTAGSAAIPRTLALPATPLVDARSTTGQFEFVDWAHPSAATVRRENTWCRDTVQNNLRLPEFTAANGQGTVATPAQRIEALNARIRALTPDGSTSINTGMRWGLALLDPAARSIFQEYANEGRMPNAFRNRPMEYNDPDVMKVIVLMSDGEHFEEGRLNDPFRGGLSPIWRANDGNYSVFHSQLTAQTNRHFVPHLGSWQSTPWRGSTWGPAAVQLTWPEVFQTFRVSYVAWQFYARPLGGSSQTARTTVFNNTLNAMRTLISVSTMNDQLQTVCNTARNLNVVVYTIAFEAPAGGQTQLRNCATTASRYYTASTTTISSVFGSIAGNISKLRLTQ